jgi:adenine-specific DNA-methyltransferase
MKIQEEISIEGSLEKRYAAATNISHRQKFAQFFTPVPIAEIMADWILGNKKLDKVLEPAFGLGIFSRILLSKNNNIKIQGFELDSKIYKKAKQYFSTLENFNIHLDDYITNGWNNKYDGIICNPPYFKFHDFKNKKTQREIEKNVNYKFNGFTNLYAFFLVKSIHQLRENGRAAYIVPSEFLNSDYGKSIKSYLKHSKTLRQVIVIDFKENIFDDVLTTASIILCAKDKHNKIVQFNKVESLENLLSIKDQFLSYPSLKNSSTKCKTRDLDPEKKWRRYYEILNADKYKNLVPFSTFGKVVRGIATGANKYFKFNKSKISKYSISKEYLLPCICRSKDVKKSIFTEKDFISLKENNKSIYLLAAENAKDKYVNAYLRKGEREEINKRYLTLKRNPWYSLENRPPAPIWVSVFNRTGMRFIRNEANISNLTTFHCIYPVESSLFSKISIDLLFAYLLTDTAKEIFKDNQREYGDGLQKFEPNDINKSLCFDLNLLHASTQKSILDLYSKYRKSILENKPNEAYLNRINRLFLQNLL